MLAIYEIILLHTTMLLLFLFIYQEKKIFKKKREIQHTIVQKREQTNHLPNCRSSPKPSLNSVDSHSQNCSSHQIRHGIKWSSTRQSTHPRFHFFVASQLPPNLFPISINEFIDWLFRDLNCAGRCWHADELGEDQKAARLELRPTTPSGAPLKAIRNGKLISPLLVVFNSAEMFCLRVRVCESQLMIIA